MIRQFSTHALPAAERLPRWEAWNRSALIGLDCQTPDDDGLRGAEINLALGGVEVAYVRAAAHRVARMPSTIEASPSGAVVAYLGLRGPATFSDLRSTVRLVPGQALMTDADRPFERSFGTAFAELAVKIPREAYAQRLRTPPPRTPAVAAPVALTAARARVLAWSLGTADGPESTSAGGIDETDLQAIAFDLVGDLATGTASGDRLSLARALVEQHLGDPLFSASALGALLGVGERQVSRLFAAADTTFPRYVSRRRLERAHRLLTAGAAPIAEVARQSGFASAAYFDRVFRERFGMTPREARTA